jgi:stage III sporulation protein AB
MIKTAGIIILAISTVIYGIFRAAMLRSHENYLGIVISMLDAIERGIRCRRIGANELIRQLQRDELFSEIGFIRVPDSEWPCRDIVHKIDTERLLNQDEKQTLSEYFSSLGSRDTESELSSVRECREKLCACLSQAKSDTRDKGRLYCSLGVLAAAFTVVFFI